MPASPTDVRQLLKFWTFGVTIISLVSFRKNKREMFLFSLSFCQFIVCFYFVVFLRKFLLRVKANLCFGLIYLETLFCIHFAIIILVLTIGPIQNLHVCIQNGEDKLASWSTQLYTNLNLCITMYFLFVSHLSIFRIYGYPLGPLGFRAWIEGVYLWFSWN